MHRHRSAVFCKRCGGCCQAHMGMLASHRDILRWQREGREDILRVIEDEETLFGRNGLGDGDYLDRCPFLVGGGGQFACAIYGTRPHTCRDFQPGSPKCAQVIEG